MSLTSAAIVLLVVIGFAAGVMWGMATRRMKPRKRLPDIDKGLLQVDTSRVKGGRYASTDMGVLL